MVAAAAAAKSLQSCPTLCDPIDGSPQGSSVHGIFQARVLEWGANALSNEMVDHPPKSQQFLNMFRVKAIILTEQLLIKLIK